MKTQMLIVLAAILMNFAACTNEAVKQDETANAEKNYQEYLLAATLWQQTSAEAAALNYQNYKLATIMLNENLKNAETDKPKAIITDLDETVIDNSAFNARMIVKGEPYSSESWAEWVKEEKADLIPGALDFLKYADSIGVHIVYLSNRADSAIQYTINNLKALELPQITNENILLKTESSNKTERRQQVLDNYEVVLYLGDNLRDFSEDFAKRGDGFGKNEVAAQADKIGSKYIVFANPMYGEWEKPILNYSYEHSDAEAHKLRLEALDIKK